jgi:oxygen-independent coproporphyrinogen-3 oxidase
MTNIAEIFSARVPRYTSYPTAPHFHAGVTEATYRQWLQELPAGTPLSLYLHIPFCDTLCWFCGCHTTVVNRYTPVRAYLDLLEEELALVARLAASDHPVTHIHWGGGSPTMLLPSDVRTLARLLRTHFNVADDAEFAIEIDPRGFNVDMADALAGAGVTRASIGVQDCDPAVQHAINRIQPMDTTEQCVAMLGEAGITQLNIDLIYGLPHQTLDGLIDTVDQVVALRPDRLAIFGYAHVPHFKKHQNLIPESALPGLEERFAQAEAARARLCEHGYVAIGLDHFARTDDPMSLAAREGRLARNFQGYTTDTAPALIGLGASSIGALPQGYVQNIADVPGYRAALQAGKLPIARGVALTREDRARRDIIVRLMCDLSVDLRLIASAHDLPLDTFAESVRALRGFADDGIVVSDGERIAIAPEWRAATRLVCAAFDAYLDNGIGRHAQAV